MTKSTRKRTRRPAAESGDLTATNPTRSTPVTRERFSAAFDRCFVRVYAYVSRRVPDGTTCERIVSEVLAANLDLLGDGGDERKEVRQLKECSDRLIGSESASSLSASAVER